MKHELKIIKPGLGLGTIKFGISRNEIKNILGEPDEKEKYSDQSDMDDMTETWHYDDLELSIEFEEEYDWKLVTISITSDFYEYKSKKLIGLSKQELIQFLEEQNINDFVFENDTSEESPDHELITSDILGINFWFDEGKISEIQWGPLFINDDTIDWPK